MGDCDFLLVSLVLDMVDLKNDGGVNLNSLLLHTLNLLIYTIQKHCQTTRQSITANHSPNTTQTPISP